MTESTLKPSRQCLVRSTGDSRALRTAALNAHTRIQDVWGKKKGADANTLSKLESSGLEMYALDYAMRLVWDLQRNGNDVIQCKLSLELTKKIRDIVMELLEEIREDIVEECTFDIPDPEAIEKREKEKRERAIADLKNREARQEKIKKEKKARELRMREKREKKETEQESEIPELSPGTKDTEEGESAPTKSPKTKKSKKKTKTGDSSKKREKESKRKKSTKQKSDIKKISSVDKEKKSSKKSEEKSKKSRKTLQIATEEVGAEKAAEAEDVKLTSEEIPTAEQKLASSRNRRRQFATLPTKGRPILRRGGEVTGEQEEPIPTIKITRELADIDKLKEKIEEKISSVFPKPLDVPESTGNDFLDFYHLSVKGPRPANEDEYSVVEHVNDLLNLSDISDKYAYFGVFDGHSGKYTSLVTRSQLLWNLFSHPDFPSDAAFCDAFVQTDKLVNDAQERDQFCCGTTALSVCIRNNEELLIGNVGDCRGFLCRAGKPYEIATPHNLDKEEEKERIKSLGGAVVWFGTWRVNGILAVSRSIGDYNLKNLVIATPDVTRIPITKEDEFLIVASDGLWDGINGTEMIEIVKKEVAENGRANVCKALCDVGIEKNTKDNVTVVALFFDHDKA